MADPISMGGDGSSRKIRLVGELVTKTNQLRDAMRGIESSSNAFANNLVKAARAFNIGSGGGRSNNFFGMASSSSASDSMSNPFTGDTSGGSGSNGYTGGGGVNPAYNAAPAANKAMDWWGNMSQRMNRPRKFGGSIADVGEALLENAGNVGRGLLTAGAGALMLAAPSLSDALQLQNIMSRQNFYGSPSSYNMGNIARQGLPVSPMDVAVASNLSIATGMMPAQAGYSRYMSSAAQISALAPGIGISGGVSAMAALNQPGNINRLRMIGINVRDIGQNNVRGIGDVINQLWAILKNAVGGREPTDRELSDSLLPGNALDSLLNQYFAGDEGLRSAVVTALFQKARGGNLSIKSLMGTGAIAGGVRSQANLYSAMFGAQQQLYNPIVGGITRANEAATEIVGQVPRALNNKIGSGFLNLASFLDAFAGIGGGSGALLLNGLLGVGSAAGRGVGSMAGVLLGNKIGGLANFLPGLGGTLGMGAMLEQLYNTGKDAKDDPAAAPAPPKSDAQGIRREAPVVINWTGSVADAHTAGVAFANHVNRTVARRRAQIA